jgi:hypothetical protein
MGGPLAVGFLAVIALTSLLQAAFMLALVLAARIGRLKLGLFEARFEATVVPRIRRAGRLTSAAADFSERSLGQAQRVDGLLAETSRKAERHLDQATARFEGAVERAALRVDAALEAREARVRDHRFVRRLAGAAAVLKGLQRALEVWQQAAAEEEDEDLADDPSPADPSPA